MIDITRNAKWTHDCCGKMDFDFNIINASTRYWPDNTAKCTIYLADSNYYDEYGYCCDNNPIVLLESEYISGENKEEVQKKVKQWYNDNVVNALEKANDIICDLDAK